MLLRLFLVNILRTYLNESPSIFILYFIIKVILIVRVVHISRTY